MLLELSCFSHVRLFVTPCTVAYQAPLSMWLSRQEYWSGLPCPPPYIHTSDYNRLNSGKDLCNTACYYVTRNCQSKLSVCAHLNEYVKAQSVNLPQHYPHLPTPNLITPVPVPLLAWPTSYSSFCPSVQFSHSVISDSFLPHGPQHAVLPCPPPTPRACSNSCPSSQWYHPIISFSVIPFSSCLQSFPASGPFPMSQFFTSGGQSIETSASASVLPMHIQDWFPLGLTGLISLQSKGISRVFSNIKNWSLQRKVLFNPPYPVTLLIDHWRFQVK